MSEHMMPIPSRLYNAAVGGHVAGADQIIDDETGLTLDKVTGGALEEKEYISGSDNGMGRVVLRKNLVEGVNTLIQTMINKSNTIYVIQYDFTLGEDITVPANCVLKFDGGSINGEYTLTGNNTSIINNADSHIFKGNITVGSGVLFKYLDIRWFGAIPNLTFTNNIGSGTDCSSAIQKAVNISQNYYGIPIRIIGSYYLANTVTITDAICLEGVRNPVINYTPDDPTSPNSNAVSTIYIEENTIAFHIVGREDIRDNQVQWSWGNFSIKNIHFTSSPSINTSSHTWGNGRSELIKMSTFGAPSRPCLFSENVVEHLYRVIDADSSFNTFSNLYFEKNCIMYCDTVLLSTESNNSLNNTNIIINNNVIEENNHLANIIGLYGYFGIINNMLESNGSSYIELLDAGYVELNGNYYEMQGGDFVIKGKQGAQNCSVSLRDNSPYNTPNTQYHIVLDNVSINELYGYNSKDIILKNLVFINTPTHLFDRIDLTSSFNLIESHKYLLVFIEDINIKYINKRNSDDISCTVGNSTLLTLEGQYETPDDTTVDRWSLKDGGVKAETNDIVSFSFVAEGNVSYEIMAFNNTSGYYDTFNSYAKEGMLVKAYFKAPANAEQVRPGFSGFGLKVGSILMNNETNNPLPINSYIRNIQ